MATKLQIAPTMARYRSASSCTAGGDGEPRSAEDRKQGQRTQPEAAASLAHLLNGPDATPPEFLSLSLTPAGEVHPRWIQPKDETLKCINAPPGYLSLSLMLSDEEKPGPSEAGAAQAKTSSGGSFVGDDASVVSSGAAETTLVVVDQAMPPPPPPVAVHAATANNVLPIKKRKPAACHYQQTAWTAPAGSSLAIVIRGDDASTSSTPGCGGDTEARSPAEPIDAVPLSVAYEEHPPAQPAWIRQKLGLPADHALHFIAAKEVQSSDMSKQLSRFLIPPDDAWKRLPQLLSAEQLEAANMHKKKPTTTEPGDGHDADGRRSRVVGKKHEGLAVRVVVNRDGHLMDAKFVAWDSNGYTVLKFGKHYLTFVRMSGLKLNDEVQIWAFQLDSGLCLLIADVTPPQMAGDGA